MVQERLAAKGCTGRAALNALLEMLQQPDAGPEARPRRRPDTYSPVARGARAPRVALTRRTAFCALFVRRSDRPPARGRSHGR